MPTYSADTLKLIDLIATNEYENILLALTIAPSTGLDLVEELNNHALSNISDFKKIFFAAFFYDEAYSSESYDHWDNTKKVCFFLQLETITWDIYPSARSLNSLVFCQNLKNLSLDLHHQTLLTDFTEVQYLRFKSLELKKCADWPLSPLAIQNLALLKLDSLSLSGDAAHSNFEVPKELAQISSLTTLFLNHNKLKSIPEELIGLKNLVELYLYGNETALQIPDKLLSLPSLNYLVIKDIPSNAFQHLSPKVSLNITHPTVFTFFQLFAWKRSYLLYQEPIFKNNLSALLYRLLKIAHLPLRLIFSAPNQFFYYIRAFILVILTSILLIPFGILLGLFKPLGKLPELYLAHTKSRRYGIVYNIAYIATRSPSSIEGLGPMGCFGAIFIFLIFFVSDGLLPFLCRYLFLPLAILCWPIDVLVGLFKK